MPRRSPDTPPPDTDLEYLESIIRHELRSLIDEVRVLRESVDALFEAFDHAVLNGRVQYVVDPADVPPQVTSFALDPAAIDFQLNTVPPEQLDELRANAGGGEASAASNHNHRPSQQGNLFDS